MSEWKTYKLGEIASFISRGVTPSYSDDGVIVINQKCIRDGKVSYEQARYTNPKIKKISNDKYLQSYDVLINSTGQGTLGRVGQVKEITQLTTVDSHVTIVRPSDKVDSTYLGYFLKSKQALIESLAEGSTGQTELARQKVGEIEIQAPSLSTQRQIAQILSSLDDKIELNLQMNQTLEAMAQAIFKEWFVHFNYPKLSEHDLQDYGKDRMKNEKVKNPTNQINPDNPVQDKLVDGLPKGWRVEKLANVCTVKYGKDHKHLDDGDIPVYGSGGIMRYAEKALYERESILIPRKGTLTNLFYITEPFWSVDTMFYTIINEDCIRKYLFYLLKTLNLASMNVGSAVPSLTTEVLNKIDIVVPEYGLLQEFENSISTFYSKMDVNNQQIKSLTQTRDTLLPKLMSGQLEVAI